MATLSHPLLDHVDGTDAAIRVINFLDFVNKNEMPRYPDDANITVDINSVDRSITLFVFIGHCWLRGYKEAEGWERRHHPDNAGHGKHRLCVEAIEKIRLLHAPEMTQCYVWLDYGCIDQDGSPADELKQLDKIVQSCDCILTPIIDNEHNNWELRLTGAGLLKDYRASAWCNGPYAYLNRGWCRMEMLYAANVPLSSSIPGEAPRTDKFSAGLYRQAMSGRRPHFLYGTKEQASDVDPLVLEPLQHSYLENFSPSKGSITKEDDREKIDHLMGELEKYIVRVNEVYEGSLDKQNRPHGIGRQIFSNGNEYDGEWNCGLMHGKGKYTYLNGDYYEGEFREDQRHGLGRFVTSNGDIYDGGWSMNRMHGRGEWRPAQSGSKKDNAYLGYWLNNMRHGPEEVFQSDSEARKMLEDLRGCFNLLDRVPCCCVQSEDFNYALDNSYWIRDRKFPYSCPKRTCIQLVGCLCGVAPACVCDAVFLTAFCGTLPCSCCLGCIHCVLGHTLFTAPCNFHNSWTDVCGIGLARMLYSFESLFCRCCLPKRKGVMQFAAPMVTEERTTTDVPNPVLALPV